MGVEILGGNELEDVGIREKPGRMGIWRVIEAGGFFFCATTTSASLTFLFLSNGALIDLHAPKNGKIDGSVARHSR